MQSAPHRTHLLCLILSLVLLTSCSRTPPPVIGHSTALKENIPLFEPFANGPFQDLGLGNLNSEAGPADFLFGHEVTTIRIQMDEEEWNSLVKDSVVSGNRSGIRRMANVSVGDSLITEVGISFMGRGSLKSPEIGGPPLRSNFMLKFGETFSRDTTVFGSSAHKPIPENKGRKFLNMPSLILKANDKDQTYIRPFLVAKMLKEFGVPTPRIGFAAVYLDISGQDETYLGVYDINEFADEDWFNRQLGEVRCIFDVGKGDTGYGYLDASTDLFVYLNDTPPCDQGVTGIPIENESDPRWRGETFNPTYTWMGGSHDCAKCETGLNGLMAIILGGPYTAPIVDGIDTETLLRYMTISAFTGNVDDFWIFGNNVFLCDAGRGRKFNWKMVPIDFDITFNQEFEDKRNPGGSLLNYGMGSLLGGRILEDEKYRLMYRNLVWTWYQALLDHSMEQTIRETVAIIDDYLIGYDVPDPFPFSEEAVQELIRFTDQKMAKAKQELMLD